MDLGSLIGLIGGFACIILAMYTSGGQVGTYIDAASALLTIGGSYCALLLNYSLKEATVLFSILGKCFRVEEFGESKIVEKLYELAEKARREGILSLEEVIAELEDKFMQSGLRLVVDGTDAEIIRNLMENELNAMNERHARWLKMIDAWSKLAPGFGMLGTVQGLIAMMKNLEDKSRIGPNMAVALITTYYGAMMANFILTPMMGKLAAKDAVESRLREMIIEGVLSIQAGDNPRILLVKLTSYLEPMEKKELIEKYGKD